MPLVSSMSSEKIRKPEIFCFCGGIEKKHAARNGLIWTFKSSYIQLSDLTVLSIKSHESSI